MSLSVKQFPDFYRAVNGYEPFPWQTRLVEEVDAHGGLWPAVLDLPTSAGKTSALDAAVFLLAMQAGKSVHQRTAPIRTYFVVDRRIVVDEAGEKARNLATKLNAEQIANPVVRKVADRLKDLSDKKPEKGPDTRKALHVSVLRGGMYRDGSWAESPTQPTICLSTVDQVGSRLLFRGYGVSPFQRAIHAGLVGNDALILVDEAHLSRPFIETLKAVEFYRSDRWAEQPVKTPFQVVVMSATAGRAVRPVGAELEAADEQRPKPLQLLDDTDKNPEVCPELHRRLTAKKLVKLVETTQAAFVGTLVKQAIDLAKAEKEPKPVRVIGVVVNRVRTAREVAELLRSEYQKDNPLPVGVSAYEKPEVVLLTGRVRPYDRDELLFRRLFHDPLHADTPISGLLPFVKAKANEDRNDYDRPTPPRGVLFVVATQTVEVGADFSFDALVTELAPLDGLRQRFGRLDRLGFRGRSHAVIVRNKDADKNDPVYGDAPSAVWKVLKAWEKASGRAKEIDFGIQTTDDRLPDDPEERAEFLTPLCAPPVCAPVMMPAHVDDWVQTSAAPVPDPEPARFLHGKKAGPADVLVVWRADLNPDLLKDPATARKVIVKTVALVPPTSMEALPVPIWQVQNWLWEQTATKDQDFTDLEGEPEPESDPHRVTRKSKPFLIWKGPDRKEDTEWEDRSRVSEKPDEIRPGNTIVVPSSYGGCDEFGWNPEHREPVTDVAEDCSWRAKRRPLIRVNTAGNHKVLLVGDEKHSAVWAEYLDVGLRQEIANCLDEVLANAESEGIDWQHLGALRDRLPEQFAWIIPTRKRPPVRYPGREDRDTGRKERGWVIIGPPGKPYPDDRSAVDTCEDAPADDEGNSFLGSDEFILLADHCQGVQARVDEFTGNLRLADSLRSILSRTGLLHDSGKGDPRFQVWLYGSEAEAARHQYRLIAKSKTEARNSTAVEAARRHARWPKGGRHEAASVLLARASAEVSAGLCDPELFHYLTGTHHGRGRPVWPFSEEEEVADAPGVVPITLDGFELSCELPTRPEAPLAALHAGWVDLFWRLVRRYGYWGLAYLETLLMLADHRQSEKERNAGVKKP